MIRVTWLALSTLLLATGCARERPVEVHGTVERDRLEIIAESNERIVEIVVHEGDHVQAGSVLVRQEAKSLVVAACGSANVGLQSVETAVTEGSTMVRLGRVLFGERGGG